MRRLIVIFVSCLQRLWEFSESPPARKDDIGDAVGVFEQRTDLGLREASDATTDLRDEERQFGMSLRKLDKLIDIGRDGLYPTLHRRDAVALPLKANTLTPDGAKLAISQEGCAATMRASQIAAEYENLIFTEFGDTVWCI